MTYFDALCTAFLLALGLLSAVNLLLWLYVLCVPPLVLRVGRLHVKRAKGLALPGLIVITKDCPDADGVLRHERAHQRQYRRYSPLGVCALLAWHYGVGGLRWRVREGQWPTFWQLWTTNPLENEAERARSDGGG